MPYNSELPASWAGRNPFGTTGGEALPFGIIAQRVMQKLMDKLAAREGHKACERIAIEAEALCLADSITHESA